MQQLPSLIFFVHRMLTENSPLSESIANVTANERNNLQYRRQRFIRHKFDSNVYTKKYTKNTRKIRYEYVFLTLQRGVTSTARHSVNITCRGVTSPARHAARSHSFVYISTS